MSLFLNLSKSAYDKPIYRIVTYDRLLQLFDSETNALVNPKKWDDPYENFILKSKVRRKNGDIERYDYHENLYGQCWTLNKASDAMWRIYSANKYGIRIRTTVQKLFSSLYHSGIHEPSWSCVIGKVRYLSEKKLVGFANSVYCDGSISKENLFQSLLVKRKAFAHEREIRILYFDLDRNENGLIYKYAIDPHDLIDQIMVDPRLDKIEAEEVKAQIKTSTGFNRKILRSLLYAPPNELILNDIVT